MSLPANSHGCVYKLSQSAWCRYRSTDEAYLVEGKADVFIDNSYCTGTNKQMNE